MPGHARQAWQGRVAGHRSGVRGGGDARRAERVAPTSRSRMASGHRARPSTRRSARSSGGRMLAGWTVSRRGLPRDPGRTLGHSPRVPDRPGSSRPVLSIGPDLRERTTWSDSGPPMMSCVTLPRRGLRVRIPSSARSNERLSRRPFTCHRLDCASLAPAGGHPRRGGRVVRQRPAKPRTPVRFRSPPRGYVTPVAMPAGA